MLKRKRENAEGRNAGRQIENQWRRPFAALLAVLLLCLSLPALCSCGKKAALENDGLKISEDVYRYWLSDFKARFVSNYSDIEDTEECWNRATDDGKTIGAYVEEYTLNYAKNALCALRIYRDQHLTLPDSKKKEIEEYIDGIIDYQYDGETSAFNAALRETYGMDIDDLREAYEIEAKISHLRDSLFGENGSARIGETELREYYEKNYACIQVIYVNTAFRYVTDKEGNRVTDPSTGYYQTEELTAEEKAEKEKKAEEAYGRLLAGEDFSAVAVSYNDLTLDTTYKEGIYFPTGDYTVLVGAGFSVSSYRKIIEMKENSLLSLDGEEVNPQRPDGILSSAAR